MNEIAEKIMNIGIFLMIFPTIFLMPFSVDLSNGDFSYMWIPYIPFGIGLIIVCFTAPFIDKHDHNQ